MRFFLAFLFSLSLYGQVPVPGYNAGAAGGGGGGGSGTVTSVSWTGGLVSIATPTTTPAFTVAGTSGGVPYFSGAATWASSAALTANGVVLGGGAGAAPTVTAADTTTTHALFATAGAPAFRAVVAGDLPNAGVFTGDVTTTFPAVTIGAGAVTNAKLANLVTAGTIPKGAANGLAASNITENADGSDNAGKALTVPTASAPTFNAGGTTTCDLSAANDCGFTMTGASTLAVTNPHGSGTYRILVTQDATGGRVLTLPGTFQGVCAPSLTASVVTTISIRFDGTNYQQIACSTTDTATVIYGPMRTAPSQPASGGTFYFDSTRLTPAFQQSTNTNKNIMPRTAETGDQLGLRDLVATISSPLTLTTDTLACATCATTTNGGALSATSPATISAAGVIACATCATTTNGGALSATSPATISAAGVIACGTCATTTNGGALSAVSPITLSAAGAIGQSQFDRLVCSLTATSSAINTTETNLCNSGSLPTATWTGTKAYVHVYVRGTNTSTAANLSTFTLRIGTGNATTDNTCVTNTPTSATSGTNIEFTLNLTCTIYTYGASGTMLGSAVLFSNGSTGIQAAGGGELISQTTATTTIDTTASNFISMWYKSAATTTTSTFYEVSIFVATN